MPELLPCSTRPIPRSRPGRPTIRFPALDAIERAGNGYPGAPLGCAEIAEAFPEAAIR
ncbi:hypothetical protein ACRAWG_01420 [Methylobacterium sp. P31]